MTRVFRHEFNPPHLSPLHDLDMEAARHCDELAGIARNMASVAPELADAGQTVRATP